MSCSPLLSALQIRVGNIYDVQQQVGFAHLVQRRFKESTKSVGNLRIKPTVSDSRNGRFSIITLRTVVSNVANSLFSANTSLLESSVIRVDLPTLVYPTNATRIRRPRFLRWVAFCLSISARRSFSNDIRFRMIRRSISNCVSPGPRRPTEPLPPPAPEPPP